MYNIKADSSDLRPAHGLGRRKPSTAPSGDALENILHLGPPLPVNLRKRLRIGAIIEVHKLDEDGLKLARRHCRVGDLADIPVEEVCWVVTLHESADLGTKGNNEPIKVVCKPR